MGGTGAGHKSARARESRLANMQKARAARKRAPLPWRSGMESRIIEQLGGQWWMTKDSGEWLVTSGEGKQQQIPRRAAPRNDNVKNSGEWLVASGERKQQQIPHPHPAKAAGWVRDDRLSTVHGGRAASRPWAKYRVARFLGVSHTWVNKLVTRFEADPERMRRKMRAFAPASFEKLERAREETRRERERGWLRGPIRWRRVKVTLEGKKRKIVAATQAEKQRRTAEVEDERARLRQDYGASREQAGAMPVRYSELPTWARGLLLPGDPGTATLPLSGRAGRPRAVPFAFHRRR